MKQAAFGYNGIQQTVSAKQGKTAASRLQLQHQPWNHIDLQVLFQMDANSVSGTTLTNLKMKKAHVQTESSKVEVNIQQEVVINSVLMTRIRLANHLQ